MESVGEGAQPRRPGRSDRGSRADGTLVIGESAPRDTLNRRDDMADETPPSYLTTAYTELCGSNQGLHEFRMKLLGILPIASVIGLVAIGKGLPPAIPSSPASIAIGFVGIFSGLFTLALFGYEIRG